MCDTAVLLLFFINATPCLYDNMTYFYDNFTEYPISITGYSIFFYIVFVAWRHEAIT